MGFLSWPAPTLTPSRALRCRRLEGLVAELVGLGRAAELCQFLGDRRRGVVVRQHTHRCLAVAQLNGQPRLVGIGQPQVLVVECANGGASGNSDPQADRPEQSEHASDGGALAGAALAHLVLLELAAGIEGENPDGVAISDPRVLHCYCSVV